VRFASVPVLILLVAPQGGPINVKCPVKPAQSARAAHVLVYEGQTIGFC
jgi:hypothetical protein